MLLMEGSPHLNNKIEEKRQPVTRNKNQLGPYLNKRRGSIYSLFPVTSEVLPMMFMRGRNFTPEKLS